MCKFRGEDVDPSLLRPLVPVLELVESSPVLLVAPSVALSSIAVVLFVWEFGSFRVSHRFMFIVEVAREGINLSEAPISEGERPNLRHLRVDVLLALMLLLELPSRVRGKK